VRLRTNPTSAPAQEAVQLLQLRMLLLLLLVFSRPHLAGVLVLVVEVEMVHGLERRGLRPPLELMSEI